MIQPEELKSGRPLKWSAGNGADVWALFCDCVTGDLDTVKRLLAKDPSLARSHHSYRKPLYFAVRENRLEIVALLLEHDPDPFGLAVNDSLLEITRDRGYPEMERLLEVKFLLQRGAKPNLPDDPPWATPLAWATRRGRPVIVELLKRHGAE